MFIYYFPQKIYLKIFFVIYLFSIWLFHFFLLILLPPSPYFITWKNAIFFLISSESTLFFLFYCMEIFFFPKFRLRPLQFSYLYTAYYKIYHGWNGRNRPVYTATRLIRVINNAQQLIKVISWDNSLFYQSSASIDKSTKLFIWLFNHDIILLLKDAFLKSYFHRQAVLKFILLGMHIQKFDIKIRNSLWSKK